MVDVSDKNITLRIATASGIIYMSQEAFDVIKNNTAKKVLFFKQLLLRL